MGGQRHVPAALTLWKDPVPVYGRLGGPVWTGAENVTSTGIRFLDRPALNGVCKLKVCRGDYVFLFFLPFAYFTRRADGPVDNIKVFFVSVIKSIYNREVIF
jgi:hypothetical protein